MYFRSSPQLLSCGKTLFLSSLFELSAVQYPSFPSQVFLPSRSSLSLKRLMALPRKRGFSFHEESPPPFQPDTPPPSSVPPLTQLSFCAQRRRACGRVRAVKPRNRPPAFLSRRFTHHCLLGISTVFHFGSLDCFRLQNETPPSFFPSL